MDSPFKTFVMNKLLLLATSLISLTIQSQGATHPPKNLSDSTQVQVKADPKQGFKNLFETTDGVSFSQLNPKAVSFVEDYMEENSSRLNKMKSWGKPYFDMIGEVFSKHGIPVELKYLSVIESDLKSSATSWAGAVGPWQFMAETARGLGLKVSRKVDERRDYKKSTVAAAKYLKELYGIYNDWLLVIAAYNCGAGNVRSAIRRSGSNDFWTMQYHLPAETRKHVKKFIATHYIMEGEGGLTTLTKTETAELQPVQAQPAASVEGIAEITVTGKYTAASISQVIGMNAVTFNSYNPAFDKTISSTGSYRLRLPEDKMTVFNNSKPQILESSVRALLSSR